MTKAKDDIEKVNAKSIRNQKLRFQKSWRWEEPVESFAMQKLQGLSPILNVPCGQSQFGDVRLDIDPEMKPSLVYDMFKEGLPYPDNYFGGIQSDPPWHINYYQRMKVFFDLVRMVKVGGIIVYNATWIPESKMGKIEEIYVRQSAPWANGSYITVFRKERDTL